METRLDLKEFLRSVKRSFPLDLQLEAGWGGEVVLETPFAAGRVDVGAGTGVLKLLAVDARGRRF